MNYDQIVKDFEKDKEKSTILMQKLLNTKFNFVRPSIHNHDLVLQSYDYVIEEVIKLLKKYGFSIPKDLNFRDNFDFFTDKNGHGLFSVKYTYEIKVKIISGFKFKKTNFKFNEKSLAIALKGKNKDEILSFLSREGFNYVFNLKIKGHNAPYFDDASVIFSYSQEKNISCGIYFNNGRIFHIFIDNYPVSLKDINFIPKSNIFI